MTYVTLSVTYVTLLGVMRDICHTADNVLGKTVTYVTGATRLRRNADTPGEKEPARDLGDCFLLFQG